MILILFSTISIICTIFFYSKTFILLKKKKSHTWELKKGIMCYSCKEIINEDDWKFNHDISKEDFKLCTSCERDQKLDEFIPSNFIKQKYINNFKKYLISKKSNKIIVIYIILVISLLSTDIITKLVGLKDIKIFSLSLSFINILCSIIVFYRTKLNTGEDKEIFKDDV
jgi:hypothetical protein